jgi:hypothetical protein
MSTSTTAMASSPGATAQRAMWDRQWRTAGIQFVVFFIITAFIYGDVPRAGASGDALAAFYGAHRTRILIASTLSGLNLLNLLWFAASLRNTLVEAGRPAQRSALCTSCSSPSAQPSPTRSPAPEMARLHRDLTTSRGRSPS